MDSLNLSEQYDKLNKMIFNGLLPGGIQIKWNHSRTNLGKTRISMKSDGTSDFRITISRFFLCTEKQYIETLIHEMIHVLMVVSGEFRKDGRVHGPLFRHHMDRINREFPQYRITIKEDGPVDVDYGKIRLQRGFLLCSGDKIYFNLLNRDIQDKDRRQVVRRIPGAYKISEGDLYFFEGRFAELATAPVRRNINTFIGKLQYLKDREAMERLRDNIIENPHIYIPIIKSNRIKNQVFPFRSL
ncbi:MAG: SprT-like domain-containing protein [Spirochaetales bacterium]|nr:SprT-like domain-containing protein [Spirochaetales bacterium]